MAMGTRRRTSTLQRSLEYVYPLPNRKLLINGTFS